MAIATHGMKYEDMPLTKVKGASVALKYAKQVNSFSLVWILLSRHKVGLLAIGNIILVLNWAFPAWPELVRAIFA